MPMSVIYPQLVLWTFIRAITHVTNIIMWEFFHKTLLVIDHTYIDQVLHDNKGLGCHLGQGTTTAL